MLIKDLDVLVTDSRQNDLYNLFAKTYVQDSEPKIQVHIVAKEEEMRMDLVSFNIYDSVDHVDFLCNFNSIDNPLNIKEGDIINYVNLDSLSLFIFNEPNDDQIKKGLLNENKAAKKDPNRTKFVEENYTLPPTFLPEPTPQIQSVGNSIIIGG
jgi:hypothetical protein